MPGTSTFQAEVTNVSKHGFWLLLADEELFLPFTVFPWFRSTSIEQLSKVEWPAENHLFWPLLDIDLAVVHPQPIRLSIDSIRNPCRLTPKSSLKEAEKWKEFDAI